MKYWMCVLLLFALKASAADKPVSSVGEAIAVFNAAKAGDRVILKNGVYQDALLMLMNNNATEAKPISFIAEEPGKVFFEGNSRLILSGSYLQADGFVWQNGGQQLDKKSVIEIKGSHNTLTNCALIDFNNKDLSVDNKWVSLYGQYNIVSNCLFKSKRNLGATLVVWLSENQPAYHTISNNYFLNRINGPDADNGLESIRIGDSKTSFTEAHCVVAFNRFENCDGEIEIISNKSFNNSYLHNSFVNNDGGLTLRHGNNCFVDGNFFDGGNKLRSYGVRIIGEGHIVSNNYFFNLKGAAKEAFRAPLTIVNGLENTPLNGYFPVRRAIVANNIFVNNVQPSIRVGARSKREGMTIAPDSLTIRENIIIDENCNSGEVYDQTQPANAILIEQNLVAGKCLKAASKGFEFVTQFKRNEYKSIIGSDNKVLVNQFVLKPVQKNNAGSHYIDSSLQKLLSKSRYTILSEKEVGPLWMR